MTNEYSEGDLVEAVKGDSKIVSRIVIQGVAPILVATNLGTRYLSQSGWTITVIEKAKPKVELPTEPGMYRDSQGDHWNLNRHGVWYCLDSPGDSGKAERYLPFERLELAAVTAETVLDHIRTYAWADGFTAQIEATAKKFGVGND